MRYGSSTEQYNRSAFEKWREEIPSAVRPKIGMFEERSDEFANF